MKMKLLAALFGVLLLFRNQAALAEDDPALTADTKDFITKVKALLQEEKHDEKDYSALFKTADDLLAKHKDQKTDQVAHVLYLKATLYSQVVTNDGHTDKAIAIVQQLKKEYPETKIGLQADKIIASLKDGEAAEKIQAALVAGAPFPDFQETDFAGQPVSVALHKGKVVLIDFWATWCGPCRAEFPNVKKAFEKYHDKGFDIIGISLDEDKDKVAAYLKENGVAWPQFYDGKGWENKLAAKYGIRSIPATFLIDADGKILGKGLRGDDLSDAVAKALASKGGA